MAADALKDPGIEAARAGLAAAPVPRAAGPTPAAEGLRNAYLELLKMALCDLGGTTTGAVVTLPDGTAAAKEQEGADVGLRAAGMDWPRYGMTMVGLRRLDDLQRCVESIVADDVEGDLIEAGTWRGGASILMRATLNSLEGGEDRTVCVADSFQGFPREHAEDRDDVYLSAFDFVAAPLAQVQANFERFGCERGVEWVPGFFANTLPGLAGRRWSLIRLDGDTREATLTTLESLYDGLSAGGYVVIDDYGAIEECRVAVDEFRAARGISEPLEAIDWTGARWRRESEPSSGPPTPPRPASAASGAPAGAPAPDDDPRPARRIPTEWEVHLDGRVKALRERLAAAQAEVEELRGSPLRTAADGLRRKLARSR